MTDKWKDAADKKPSINEDGSLSYSPWVKRGSMLYNRECLEHDDPNHLYNYLKTHGIRPEDYGIQHPLNELMDREFRDKSRGELISEIMHLRKEMTSVLQSGFF